MVISKTVRIRLTTFERLKAWARPFDTLDKAIGRGLDMAELWRDRSCAACREEARLLRSKEGGQT